MKATWPAHFERFFRGLMSVGADLQAGAAGSGTQWKALCPSHDDTVHSLSIGIGRDGRLIIRCHSPANCAAADITAAVGCTLSDLYPDEDAKRREREARLSRDAALAAGTSSRYIDDLYRDLDGRPEIREQPKPSAIPPKFLNRPRTHNDPAKGKKMSSAPATVVKAYDYRDEAGNLLFQVCRTNPKGFRQRRPNPDYYSSQSPGAENPPWLWNIRDTRIVLYNVPDMLAAWKEKPARAVFVVEGEKDADLMKAAGLLATTMPGGAFKWRKEYTEFLKGRHVVVIPDEDPIMEAGYSPGIKHATEVCNALVGVAASVRMLRLPGVPPKGDFSDWWTINQVPGENGPSIEETKKKFGALVVAAPEWKFDPSHGKAGEAADVAPADTTPSIPGTVTSPPPPATVPPTVPPSPPAVPLPAPVPPTVPPVPLPAPVPPTPPAVPLPAPSAVGAAAAEIVQKEAAAKAAAPAPAPAPAPAAQYGPTETAIRATPNVKTLFAHALAAAAALRDNGVKVDDLPRLVGNLRLGLGRLERIVEGAVFSGEPIGPELGYAVGMFAGLLVLAAADTPAAMPDKPRPKPQG